jgi:hypothetical protein
MARLPITDTELSNPIFGWLVVKSVPRNPPELVITPDAVTLLHVNVVTYALVDVRVVKFAVLPEAVPTLILLLLTTPVAVRLPLSDNEFIVVMLG